MLALEIFGSVLTHEERCASLPAVVQSGPRPNWACASVIQTKVQQEDRTRGPCRLRISRTPFRAKTTRICLRGAGLWPASRLPAGFLVCTAFGRWRKAGWKPARKQDCLPHVRLTPFSKFRTDIDFRVSIIYQPG